MKLPVFMILALSLMGFFVHTYTRVHVAKTERRLDQLLRSKELSFVCFYEHYRADCDDCVRDMHAIFKATSQVPRYKDAEILFVEANTTLADFQDIVCDYNLRTFPTYMIFRNGDPLSQGRLQGCASKADLMAFLDDTIGDEIEQILNEKEEIRRRNLEENIWWYNYYGYPWYGYCRPGFCDSYYYGPSCWFPWYNPDGCCGNGGYVNFGFGFCR